MDLMSKSVPVRGAVSSSMGSSKVHEKSISLAHSRTSAIKHKWYTMYIHIRNGNNESLFHAHRVLRGPKGSGASMDIRVDGPFDQSAPGVVLVNLGF